jgi:hypothetical protein
MEESILSRFDDLVKCGKVFYDKDQETIHHKEGQLEVNKDDKSYEITADQLSSFNLFSHPPWSKSLF